MSESQVINKTGFSFSGHETFPFRYAWLKKGYDAIHTNPTLFTQEDQAMVILGVGKNMVRSIRHWCLATNVLEPVLKDGKSTSQLQATALGHALFRSEDGLDPYLEDTATLWILHWHIASRPERCTTWYWVLSHIHEPEFSKKHLLDSLQRWTVLQGVKRASENTLERDIDCFIRTYCISRDRHHAVMEDSLDCPLTELGLLHDSLDREYYRFERGPKESLNPSILLYAITHFWDTSRPSTNTFSLADLAYAPGSPGRVFQLDEGTLAQSLEDLESLSGGAIRYDDTAGLRQLLRKQSVKPLKVLKQAYASAGVKRKRAHAYASH